MHDFPAPDIWLPHRVSYGETDTMGFVYYAEYLHYFERARTAYIRQCGVSYATIEERGVFLPVREATCRYRAPAHYDELLYIRIAVSELGRASLRFVYEVRDESKERLMAQGSTQHALIRRDGKPIPMPDWFKDILSNVKQPGPNEPLY
ncbi:MAG: acyl-CoA thioesterase [Desulfovibrionaceae bacterium]|nr:acyl-CoA thioesterase [Desulfovibrionaceae bacterium]